MKLEITETIKKTHNFTWNYFTNAVTGDKRGEQKNRCMSIFSKLLRKYRYEILGTYAGYKVICNGYGAFKRIEIEDKVIKQQEIMRKLKAIYDDENAFIDTGE